MILSSVLFQQLKMSTTKHKALVTFEKNDHALACRRKFHRCVGDSFTSINYERSIYPGNLHSLSLGVSKAGVLNKTINTGTKRKKKKTKKLSLSNVKGSLPSSGIYVYKYHMKKKISLPTKWTHYSMDMYVCKYHTKKKISLPIKWINYSMDNAQCKGNF